MKKGLFSLAGLLLAAAPLPESQAQTDPSASKYDYHAAFNPNFYTSTGNEFRSASGVPGPKYWQNRSDYDLAVSLDESRNLISGKVTITYTNNSPDDMDFLWVHLDQNLFARDARGKAIVSPLGSRYDTQGEQVEGGFKIGEVKLAGKKNKGGAALKYEITDTRMQVFLPEKLKAGGGKISFSIEFGYVSPKFGADRTGIQDTKNGKIFCVAQWYPRMAVYDDVLGWNTVPYTGPGEFYLGYGDFNVAITAPDNHIVVCSGELLNEKEVFNSEELKRYQQAKTSDKTVIIRSAAEIGNSAKAPGASNGKLTWRFRMKNTRDVAWASSAAFILDAARINLPDGKSALAMSAYPIESDGQKAWGRSTEYTKASIEHYSRKWYPYPYTTAVNVAGNVAGMEYPGIVFCHYQSRQASLWGVTDHEFGHIWFPMIVGSNERLHGWMDEGFNTFINGISTDEFNNGEYREPKRNMHAIANMLMNDNLEPVMTAPAGMKERNIGTLLYYKPAIGLELLRNQILGPERFDRAFREYIHRWAYKHPTPYDFFRTMENVSGESLSWFWRGWFLENWKLDQAVTDVKYVKNDPAQGALITIANMEKLPMPVEVQVTTASGKKIDVKLPVEIWERNKVWTFKVNAGEKIAKVEIDPEKNYPDVNPSNNVWKAEE